MRYHHLSIVVLVETCIFGQRFATVSTAMGFDRVVRSDATSFSGGIWLLWDSTQVQLDILIVFYQVIYASVQVCSHASWLFSAIYASPSLAFRIKLWDHLAAFVSIHSRGWLQEILMKFCATLRNSVLLLRVKGECLLLKTV
jgi:hypothetical protein